jgi:transposase-like protein
LEPIIRKHVEEGSDVYTDELLSYNGLGKWYNHQRVIHRNKQYVNGKVTTNRIENVWSVFKKTIKGTYHNNISDKYLPNYINELTFRYNTRKYTEEKRLELLFLTMMGRSLTYQEFSQL